MSVALPTGRPGQILAGVLTLLAAVFIWLSVIAPALEFYRTRNDQVDSLRARYARDEALVQVLPRLAKVAELASHTPVREVLTGNSDAIAGATLQEKVQNMASSVSAQLTSVDTLPGVQAEKFRRIGVRVELSAELPELIQLIAAIEEAQPSMMLDDVRLNSGSVDAQNAQLPLNAVFSVYAFRVGTAKEDSP